MPVLHWLNVKLGLNSVGPSDTGAGAGRVVGAATGAGAIGAGRVLIGGF